MTQPPAPRPTATVAVQVDAAPAIAFDLFTRELDLWWRRTPRYRHAGDLPGIVFLEPFVGGRLGERWRDGDQEREFVIGTVTAWDPPRRVAFTWRNATFAPSEETDVEVTFAAVGEGTLVTVRHHGWESLRPDHPARHGADDGELARQVGLWWGEQLRVLRSRTRGGR